MRTPHYWKKAGPAACPSEMLVFDCETQPDGEYRRHEGELHRLRIGHVMAYRLVKGKRTRAAYLDFTIPGQFWDFVYSRLSPHRPLWIWGHNIAYDLGIVGAWKRMFNGQLEVMKCVLDGNLFFVKGLLNGLPLWLCDTFNYWRMSLRRIGKGLGMEKGSVDFKTVSTDCLLDYCRNDVAITAAAVDTLIAFVREHNLGPWQQTVAGLAFSAYRHRFMRHKVLVHTYKDSLKEERAGYYGGIVDTRFIGTVPASPVHECDVCSMYPAVCLNRLPHKIIGRSDRIGPIVLGRMLAERMVIGDVDIQTQGQTYPYRVKGRVYYPTGRFRTVLADAELRAAYEAGHISHVHSVTTYDSAPIFEDYMRFFVEKKTEYRNSDNPAFGEVCKLFATNLYGKTGQQTPKWLPWNAQTFSQIEAEHGLSQGTLAPWYSSSPKLSTLEDTISWPDFGIRLWVRNYWGTWEIRCGEQESRDSCPAIAACVTSLARVKLRHLQGIVGVGQCFYSDTDSVWTSDSGLQRLRSAGYVSPGTIGFMDAPRTYSRFTVYGPKDYTADAIVKRKGIRANADPTDSGGWYQLDFPSAKEQIKSGIDDGVLIRHCLKHLRRTVDRVHVQPDGWTRPLNSPEDFRELCDGKTA